MDLVNQIINNRFLIQFPIASGILTVVYKARDIQSDRELVLKFIKPESTSKRTEDLIRYKREVLQVMGFEHPHIARPINLGEYQGQNYLTMELIEAYSLDRIFWENKRFTIPEVVEIVYQIASALEYAHNQNLLHLDLRPSNVVVNYAVKPQVKILDFGLSHLIEYTQIKKPEDISAVFSYISPEQSGIMKRASDERSDLYSLGILFYQLLTGESPFKGDTVGVLLHQHMAKVPTSPRRLNPQIPEVLEQMILKLLAKEPEARYQTAKGLVADLELFRQGTSSFVIGKQDRLKKLLFRTRLIGREEEFNKLKDAFEKAKSGIGQVTLVKGEAGRGKSRLVDEIRSYVYERKGTFLSGRCFSQENKIPYQPFRDILNEYIDKLKKTEPAQKEKIVSRLKEALGELGEIILKINPNMEEILGKQPPLVALDPEREHRRFLMVASRFFLNLGTKDEPFVLFLDDLQWSDEASLSLLSEITSQIKDFPLLILGTFRDNEVTETHSLYKIIQEAKTKQYPLEEIPLALFDHNRLNKFLAELLLEDEERITDLSKFILDKSKGNPFFSIEITRQLVEEKALNYDENKKHWLIDWQRLNQITISTNIIEVVLRRIDTLEADKLQLLSYASVIGREFPLKLLFNLVGFPEERLITLIDDFISLQFLEKSLERSKVLFVHDRIRDAFYAKVPQDKLKELHLQIAYAIEELHKENIESFIFDLAHHFTEAGDKDKALQYCLPAAKKAKQNYANEEAERYYNLAIKILEEKEERGGAIWIEAKEGLAEIYLTIGKNDEVIQISHEVLSLKETSLEKARVYHRIGSAYFKKGLWQECEDTMAKGLALLQERIPIAKREIFLSLVNELSIHITHLIFPKIFEYKGKYADPKYPEIIRSYMSLSWTYILSNVEKFTRSTLRILNLAESKIGRSKELATCLGAYASLCMAISLFKRGIIYHEKALKMTKEVNDEWGQAECLQFMGYCYEWMGDYQKSIEHHQQSLNKFEKIGDTREIGMVVQGLGFDYFYLADYKKTLEYWSGYLEIGEKTKDAYGISNAWAKFMRVYLQTGDFDKAEEWGKKALELSEEKKVWFINCYACIHFGHLNIERENYDEAIEYLKKARKLDRENNFLKNYVIFLYYYLAEAYLGRIAQVGLKGLKVAQRKHELRKIKSVCKDALWQTRPWKNHHGQALRVNGKYYAFVGNRKKAEKFFLKSIQHHKDLGRRYELGKSLYEYANFLNSLGKADQAKLRWQEAFNVFKEIGAKLYIQRTAQALGIKVEEEKKELTAQERLAVERRLNTLITVSHHLSSILDLEELLGKIVSSAIEVSGAERGFLLLFTPDKNTLQIKIVQGTEPGLEITPTLDSKKYKLCKAIIDEVQTKVSSLLYNPQITPSLNQDEDIRAYQIKSVICTPLKVREELLGLLYLDNRLTEAAFNEQDLNLVNSFATQAGISLQNAFLVREMVEKERLAEELKLGREIQMALLPHQTPDVSGLTVQGLMQPAKEIGGDYYDFITLPDKNQLSVVIGDVSGKGVAAGLLMAMAKTAIHTLSQEETSPKQILLKTNQILNQHIGGQKFMTLLYFKWDAAFKTLTYSSAGHEHILIYRSSTDEVESLVSGGFMLGMIADIERFLEEKQLKLKAHDKILLYTDGVTEAENQRRDRFGLERVKESLKKHGQKPAAELMQAIKDEVYSFIGPHPQYDDITLVVLEAK